MADRTVYVELDLHTGKYKAGIDEARAGADRLDEKIEATNRDLDATERKATEAAAAMKLLGASGEGAFIQLDDGAEKSSTSLGKLEKDLVAARLEVGRLGEEFNKTGSGETLDKLFDQQNFVKGLEGLKKKLTSALSEGAKEAAPKVTKSLFSSVSSGATEALSGVDSPMLLAVIGAAPLIAGAVGAAIATGGGLGLVALGAYFQRGDPGITAGLKKLENDAIDVFAGSSESLTKPFQIALGTIDDWLLDLKPAFQSAFAAVAPAIGPFVGDLKAILGPIIEQLPALGHAFAEIFSDPIVSEELKEIGEDVANVFGTINSDGTALKTTFGLLSGAVWIVTTAFDGLLNAVNAIETPWSWLTMHAAFLLDNVDESTYKAALAAGKILPAAFKTAFDALDKFGHVAALDQQGLNDLSTQISQTTVTADSLAGAMTDKVLGSLLAVKGATLSWHQGLTGLQDSLKENGRSFDENTKAGQANMSALLQVVSANKQAYDSNIANGMSAADAAKKYDENTQALDKVLKKAGLTDKQIQDMTGDMNNVPDQVNADIAFHGLTEAIEDLGNLIREVNGIPPTKTVRINYVETYSSDYQNYRAGERDAYGAVRHAAVGMIVGPSDPGTLIGEPQTGGEALIPLRGISAGRAQMLGNVAMSGYGMTVVPRGMTGGMPGGGTRTLQPVTIALPSGEPLVRTIIEYALNTGRTPAQLFPAAAR